MAPGDAIPRRPAGVFDMHVHSRFSPDSTSDLARVCARAAEMGIPGLCFTDHAEFAPGDHVPDAGEMAEMGEEIRALRHRFAGRLEILFGIEIGYYPGRAADIGAFLKAQPFDFVLGSVHVSGDTGYSFPRSFRPGFDPRDYYGPYLEDLGRMVEEVDVDAVGHFDLPKRYGPRWNGPVGFEEDSPLWEGVLALLARMVQRGILLEVNTSGLRQDAEDLYPSRAILRAFRTLGGDAVTLGSDSHQPSHMGWGLDRAAEAARRAGFTRGAYFAGREVRYYAL